MASITLNIPDDQLERVVEALCERHGYEEGSKEAFAQSVVLNFLSRSVQQHEADLAKAAASISVPPVTGLEFD